MRRRFSAEEGDHLTYLNVYTMFIEVMGNVGINHYISEWEKQKMVRGPFC